MMIAPGSDDSFRVLPRRSSHRYIQTTPVTRNEWCVIDDKIAILLVDDEPVVHLMVGMLLRHAGYFVGDANDGVVALGMFEEGSWDLVLTDRVMPEMGGEKLAEEIRKLSSDVPLVLITGFLKLDTVTDSFDEVVEKPFTAVDLLAAIRRALERKRVGPMCRDGSGQP